jgi:hypothetical protein
MARFRSHNPTRTRRFPETLASSYGDEKDATAKLCFVEWHWQILSNLNMIEWRQCQPPISEKVTSTSTVGLFRKTDFLNENSLLEMRPSQKKPLGFLGESWSGTFECSMKKRSDVRNRGFCPGICRTHFSSLMNDLCYPCFLRLGQDSSESWFRHACSGDLSFSVCDWIWWTCDILRAKWHYSDPWIIHEICHLLGSNFVLSKTSQW